MTSRKKEKHPTRTPERPVVGVGVVVWRGDEILLVKRKNLPGQGQWGLPGGKQELGETVIEAAAREVREETGVEIALLEIVTVVDAITRDAKGKIDFHYTIIEVAAVWRHGDAIAGDDALEVRWVAPIDVAELCAWPEVARVVRLSMLQRVL